MTAATTRPALSDEQLDELLGLISDADSVELKLTVPGSDHYSAVGALRLDPLDAQIRQVYFFDTPELALYKQGVVVRARRVQKKGDDCVVKLRPVVPDEVPKALRESPHFGVEVDAMPGGYVCSGSLKRTLGTTDVRGTVTGERPLHKLFSKEQRALFSDHAPEGVALDDLSVLGPIFVLKQKASSAAWWRSCGCTRTIPGARALHEVPAGRGLPRRGREPGVPGEARRGSLRREQAKTRKALEFFSARLRRQAD